MTGKPAWSSATHAKIMQACSLRQHLDDVHDKYQQDVVDEELVNEREGIQYRAVQRVRKKGKGKESSCAHTHHTRDAWEC